MSDWDIVLRGGRVIDPESGLDAVLDVAVAGGRMAGTGNGLRPARAEFDVAGLVVTAGFVDLHSHVNTVAGLRLQALDGVTTALELEAGVTPAGAAYRIAAAEGRPVNYGFAASWALARMEAVAGIGLDGKLATFLANIANPAWQRPAAPAEITAMLARLSADLAGGALGIGVLAGYAPATSPAEYLQVAALAAEAGVPAFTHSRDLIEMVPDVLIDGAEEIVRAAGQTGAHMHYCHVNSTSQRHVGRVLDLIGRAQAAGARVTTEAYPYGSGMTGIGAAFLAPERLAERGLSPASLTYRRAGRQPGPAARAEAGRSRRAGDHRAARRGRPSRPQAADALPYLPRRHRGQRRHAADLDRASPRPAHLAAARHGGHPPADRRDILAGAAPAHPRRRAAQPGPGAEQMQPAAGPAAARPRASHAPQGPAAGRQRR